MEALQRLLIANRGEIVRGLQATPSVLVAITNA